MAARSVVAGALRGIAAGANEPVGVAVRGQVLRLLLVGQELRGLKRRVYVRSKVCRVELNGRLG